MSRRVARRSLALIVLMLAVAASVIFASPANATTCGTGGCGRYYIEYEYAGGTVVDFSYQVQDQWMVDATNGDQRGIQQISGYSRMTVSDITNGFATTVTFCVTPQYPCRHTYSNGVDGQSGWVETVYPTGAGCVYGAQITAVERVAWAYYLQDEADYYLGNRNGARLTSPAGNSVAVGCA